MAKEPTAFRLTRLKTLPETGETVVGHVLDMISEPSPTTYYPRCDVPDSESLVSVDPFQR